MHQFSATRNRCFWAYEHWFPLQNLLSSLTGTNWLKFGCEAPVPLCIIVRSERNLRRLFFGHHVDLLSGLN